MKKVKRRKNKYNPYTLEVNHIITFMDSRGKKQTILLNDELYQAFNSFELQDLKEMNEYDRHIEHLEVTEESLYHNTKNNYQSLEELVLKKMVYENLYQEIEKLPTIQKRRLKMYYFDGLSQREIAKKERTSIRAIQYTLKSAIKELEKNCKKFKI